MVSLIVILSVVILFYSISNLDISIKTLDAGELVQISEAGINDIVLIGAAIFFLVSVEIRIKRSRALEALHELRTIAHVIDMHQLTKDPTLLNKGIIVTSSPSKKANDAT